MRKHSLLFPQFGQEFPNCGIAPGGRFHGKVQERVRQADATAAREQDALIGSGERK
jgi:hypothetical protein